MSAEAMNAASMAFEKALIDFLSRCLMWSLTGASNARGRNMPTVEIYNISEHESELWH